MKELTTNQVLLRIQKALERQQPFTLVRIGDGENIVLAQRSVWSLEKVYRETWSKKAMRGTKGVSFPNFTLRDQMVTAIKNADIVGILPENDTKINAPSYLKRPLTDAVFKYFDIRPKLICDAKIMRECAKKPLFWNLFKNKRVLIIYQHAPRLKAILKSKYGINVSVAIPFRHYNQFESTLKVIENRQGDFDVALLSCGVNSPILAWEIAKRTRKAAIDFGKPANFMVTGAL